MPRTGYLFALALALAAPAEAADVPCASPPTAAWEIICSDPDTAGLAEQLDRAYAVALDALRDGAVCLEADQQAWQRDIDDTCVNAGAACFALSFRRRLSELDALQPGIGAMSDPAPDVPALLVAIPPDRDAPPATGAPLTVEGHLFESVEEADALGIFSDVPVMVVNEVDRESAPSHLALSDLVRGAPARYRVDGVDDGSGGFAMGACRMVRRVGPGFDAMPERLRAIQGAYRDIAESAELMMDYSSVSAAEELAAEVRIMLPELADRGIATDPLSFAVEACAGAVFELHYALTEPPIGDATPVDQAAGLDVPVRRECSTAATLLDETIGMLP